MKYKHWDEYSDAKRWNIAKKESQLETNNATTKEDLTNIVKFLIEVASEWKVEDFESDWEVERCE